MFKKLIRLMVGKECELRERMFRTIILLGGLASAIGIIEIIFTMELDNFLVPILILLLAVMAISLVISFRYNKLDLAAILMGLVIIVMIFPVMFCLSGGIESGAPVWLALGILYIFIMFSGKKFVFFLVLCLITYSITYILAYNFPQLIVPMKSKGTAFFDSIFSVFVIGIVSGCILKLHMRVFEQEHELTIAQKEELEKTSNAKNVLFANMSHEIRTPINTIIGLNEMIIRENSTGSTREYAQDIQLASKMLLNQVNDILDLSQMEMKKMNIVPVQYNVENMFGELVDLIKVQADKKGLELRVDIDKNLPSVLVGDEKRIKQILLNLLDNAVKYTKEGYIAMSVQGENAADGEISMKVKVADTGMGIRKEDMEYIYDSFNRVDENNNSRIVGSGLGLAITKQLVDLMEGEITVDSIYTKGTVFTVILKQGIADAKSVGSVNLLKRQSQDTGSYKPSFEAPEARILVVDDNSMNSRVAASLLSYTKVQVDTAGSGEECLKMTMKKYYHVILLDYMMPVMDGHEVLKAIRSQENGLCRESAIIALTANAMYGSRQIYREQGFDGYVEKPVQSRLLEQEILNLLPSEIIEYRESETTGMENDGQIQRLTRRKRKKIYITADCVCDIPPELLEKYDIKLMYLYIRTPHGRFADTKEIDSDSLTQYLSTVNSVAYADSVTMEEYEEFFAETLTQAERVVHISMASRDGMTYNLAVAAARCFDHVHIIDSGQISCGMGLVTLYAAKLAAEGCSAREIIDSVEKMKSRVKTRVVMPGINIFYQNGRTGRITALVCNFFKLHPYTVVRHNKTVIRGMLAGSLENAWKQAIYWHLHNRRKINSDVVFITYVGLTVKQLEWIKAEVLKYVPFDKVIIQKASFSTACNSGLKTVGISYYSL